MWEKIQNLDRRIIYIFVALSVIIPLVNPLGLPVNVSEETRRGFNAIDSLPPGSRVLFSCDYDPASEAELFPMNIAILRHCLKKNLRVVAMGLWPQGCSQMDKALDEIKKDFPKFTYGVDYVNMGYKTGGSIIINAIGGDFIGAFPTDKNNTPIRDIPILRDVKNYSSFDMIINLSAGTPGTPHWVAFAGTKFGINIVSGCTAVSAMEFYPYFGRKQIIGLVNGLAGSAEYELLVGAPGRGIRGMDAQSIAHLVIIFFILLGNAILLHEKITGKRN